MQKWDYNIGLEDGVRIYNKCTPKEQKGIVWNLQRTTKLHDGTPYSEHIITSVGVFEDTADAVHDALQKLSILRCPIERPIDVAIKNDLLEPPASNCQYFGARLSAR